MYIYTYVMLSKACRVQKCHAHLTLGDKPTEALTSKRLSARQRMHLT